MKLLVYVMIKTDLLQPLLAKLAAAEIKGATILDSSGMGRELADSENDEFSIFGSMRAMIQSNNRQTKTLLFVTEDAQVSTITSIIENVVGKLDGPNTGIIFTLPIDFTKGYKK